MSLPARPRDEFRRAQPAVAPVSAGPTGPPVRRLGRFELRRELGRGAQASVWLAHDPRLQREVALKLLDRHADTLAVSEWLHEARAVSRLTHPNIVPVFEADSEDGQPYLVFEWVEGRTLAEAARGRGPWPPHEAVALLLGVLDALAAAHAQGIVHRDLKPSNILLGPDGRARVMDFGIAARSGGDGGDGLIVGTPGYMSPEAARGEAPAPAMDVFAAGLVLAGLLCGRPLLAERDVRRALERVQREDLALPADAAVDATLRAIVGRALARDPGRRYDGARALHAALSAWGHPAAAAEPGPGGHGTLEFLLRRMRHKSDFPALSETVVRIQRLAASDTESLGSLAAVILEDVALTHKLLRVVNSAHYSHSGGGSANPPGRARGPYRSAQNEGSPVSTVSRAVALVGFAGIRNLALSLVLLEHMNDKVHAAQLQQEFLRALTAGMLAAELTPMAGEAEEAFIASMFQNLGRLLTGYYFPEEAQQVRQWLQAAPDPEAAEAREAAAQRVLGIGFEEIGVGVARSWGFPEALQRCMRAPSGAPPNRLLERSAERGPDRNVERLRWLGRAANEMTDAMLAGDGVPPARALAALAERYAPALGVSRPQVLAAAAAAREGLARQVRALGLQIAAGAPLRRLMCASAEALPPAPDSLSAHALTSTLTATLTSTMADGHIDLPTLKLPPRADAGPPPAELLAAGIQDVTASLVADEFRLEAVLRMVLETMLRALGLRRVVFCLRDPKTDTLSGRFGLGDDAPALCRVFRVPLHEAAGAAPDLFAVVCRKGVDTLIDDSRAGTTAARLPRWYRDAVGAPSFLLLPLTLKQATFGLIYGDRAEPGGIRLGEQELALLRTLRNQAVMAFRQAEGPR
jgi:eukaryotic-like serine/threonine-protein kinase